MQIKQEKKNDIIVCYIEGDVDINTSPQIKKTIDKLIGRKEPKIIINFKNVSYVDSSGLATLVEILKNLKSYGGRLKLTNLSTKIKSLFEITKLEKLFEIIADEEEAINTFA